MYHLSVCVETKAGSRAGFVISGANPHQVVKFAETVPNRIGYCGNSSFDEAVHRAALMANNLPDAWGVIKGGAKHAAD